MLLYDFYRQTYHVTTDSRQVPAGSVFFALKGERFDGNDFALEVAEQGIASLVVCDRPSLPDHPRLMKVDDSLKALQDLARYHRQQLKDLTVIAITGTNGKTTTKELVSTVLGRKYKVTYTQGNFNNHIGVPLTLLSITPDTEIAVVEMGANHPGEIKTLADIACPDYGLITNIGKAHLEGFGSFEGVIRTKNELYDHLRAHGKAVFVNSDNDLLMGLVGNLDHYTYGSGVEAACLVKPKSSAPYLAVTAERLGDIQTRLVGAYNFENVAAAIAVGNFFSVSGEDIREALEQYQPTNSRSQVIEGRNCIIMDAYNANPTSMSAAVRNFRTIAGDDALPILGDMRELGEASEQEHKAILELLASSGFHEALLVGPCFSQYNNHPEYRTFPNVEALNEYLQTHPVEQRTILVKGSHGIHLEKVLPLIQ